MPGNPMRPSITHRVRLIIVLSALAACSCTNQKNYEDFRSRAKEQRQLGNYPQSLQLYDEARKQIGVLDAKTQTSLALERSKVAVTYANQASTQQTEVVDELEKARADLEHVKRVGTPAQIAEATSFLALIYMQRGDFPRASQLFHDVQIEQLSPADQAATRYNFGRALEREQRPADAYEQFLLALKDNPKFAQARQGLERTSAAVTTTPQDSVRIAREMIDSGNIPAATEHIYRSLWTWRNDLPSRNQLLGLLLDSYVSGGVTRGQYVETHEKRLDKLDKDNRELDRLTDGVDKVFKDNLSVTFNLEDIPSDIRAWCEIGQGRAIAKLLAFAGNQRSAEREPQQALARHAMALTIDPPNTDAALHVAAILSGSSDVVDREGKLRDQFINRIFNQKNDIYSHPDLTVQDYQNLLTLHLILAEALAQHPRGSSTSAADFQWRKAKEVEQRLRQIDASSPPAPVLHERCGAYYAATSRPALAAAEYLDAAEGYRRLGQPDDQQRIIAALQPLRQTLSKEHAERLNDLLHHPATRPASAAMEE